MRLWMALLALLPACGFNRDPLKVDSGAGSDAPDAPVMPDASYCYGTFVRVCFEAMPMGNVVQDTIDIDTDSTTMCNQANDQASKYCVIASGSFTLASGKTVTAHGQRPLILLSTTTFELNGDIDVSSKRTGSQPKGAGADAAECVSGTTPSLNGGGCGGSFGSKGGNGGDGRPAGGTSGLAADPLPMFPIALRGGCRGGSGSLVGTAGEGSGGSGGGAIAIIAAQIRLDGRINASGAGGHGAPGSATGGGGGGSGGMIVLDSTMISLTSSRAKMWANGGGGAQGGAIGMAGANGNESLAPELKASATDAPTDGCNGGSGSLAASPGENGKADGRNTAGGGGGGGGAGFIWAHNVTGPATISPPSTEP